MRKVHLHGALGKKYGTVFNLEVSTAGEAVRALATNFPEFIGDVRDGAWHVVRGDDPDNGFDLDEDDIVGFKLGKGDLHIVPYIAGSKRDGMLKIILGGALIGAAFAFSGGALATPIIGGGGFLGGFTYGNMAAVGLALALAGASSLLTPEEDGSDSKKDQSFTFSGPGNTEGQGGPLPLIYGEVITGGVLVSGGIDVERIPGSSGGSASSGGGKK